MFRRTAAATVALLAFALFVAATPTAEAGGAPPGFAVQDARALVAGVEYHKLVGRDGPVVAHVVRIARDAPVTLRTVLSNDRIGRPAPTAERTSEMCRRVHCVAAVNGDFYVPGTGTPLGAMASGGAILRSPVPSHHQLMVTRDGEMSAGTMEWSARLVPSDLVALEIDGVNVERSSDALVLFTPALGPATATNEFGAELVVRIVDPPGPLVVGQTALVEMQALVEGKGDNPIPPDGAVLSGHGTAAEALRVLWRRVEAGEVSARSLLRLDTVPAASEAIGGTPILLHEGRRWAADDGSDFTAGRHPRTIVGWSGAEVLLVTVDGRDGEHSRGLSLPAAADLLAGLGATDAINLDGGGSSTMVVGGVVVNRPSDRLVRRGGKEAIVASARPGDAVVGVVERPVANALAVVTDTAPPRSRAAVLGPGLQLPRELSLPRPEGDPASHPGGLPALLTLPAPARPAPAVVALAATANAVMAQTWALLYARHRRRRLAAWRGG